MQTAFDLGHRIGNVVRMKKDTGTGDGVLGVEMALKSTCGGVRSSSSKIYFLRLQQQETEEEFEGEEAEEGCCTYYFVDFY